MRKSKRNLDFRGQSLTRQRFFGDLRGADFSGARLQGANFWRVRLDGANFSGAVLVGACFREAHLNSANFVRANLTRALLNRAHMWETDFSYACMNRVDLKAARDIEGPGERNRASYTFIRRCSLARASLSGADLRGTFIINSNLSGADLTNANLSAKWKLGELTDGEMRRLNKTLIIASSLQNARIRGANMRGTILHKIEISPTNLRLAISQGAEVRRRDWSAPD